MTNYNYNNPLNRESLVSSHVILLGAQKVGKSALLRRLMGGETFIDKYEPTKVTDYAFKTYRNDACQLTIQGWATSGNKSYHSMNQSSLINCPRMQLILVYDPTDKNTFDELDYYVQDYRKKILQNPSNSEPISIYLVSTKEDLIQADSSSLTVTDDDVVKFMEKYHIDQSHLVKVSAKTGHGISQLESQIKAAADWIEPSPPQSKIDIDPNTAVASDRIVAILNEFRAAKQNKQSLDQNTINNRLIELKHLEQNLSKDEWSKTAANRNQKLRFFCLLCVIIGFPLMAINYFMSDSMGHKLNIERDRYRGKPFMFFEGSYQKLELDMNEIKNIAQDLTKKP